MASMGKITKAKHNQKQNINQTKQKQNN